MRSLRTAPIWVVPFLALSVLAATVAVVFLVPYFALIGIALGAAALRKDLASAPAEYQSLRPTKGWDGVFAWFAVPALPGGLRLSLFGAALSAIFIVIAIAHAGEGSAGFAWGFLGGVAAAAGVESFMRHRGVGFKVESGWVFAEGLLIVVAALVGDPDWLIGIAAAASLEVVGYVVYLGIALSRVQTSTQSE